MLRLFKNILLFLLPPLVILFVLPENKRLRFINMENDCSNQSIWMYDRLYNNTASVDIAVFGSSRGLNGINDKTMTEVLGNDAALNLSYCRYGVNIYLPFLRNLLETKKPKKVIFEVQEYLPRFTHAMFPYAADETDVFTAYPWYNPNLFSDMYISMIYKTELLQQQFFNSSKQVVVSDKLYGHSASVDTLANEILDEARARRYHKKDDDIKLFKPLKYAYSMHYLSKVSALCKEAGAKVYLLYMPGYGFSYDEPPDAALLSEIGTLLVPPKSITENRNYWHDKEHLNAAGADVLSSWLAQELKD